MWIENLDEPYASSVRVDGQLYQLMTGRKHLNLYEYYFDKI